MQLCSALCVTLLVLAGVLRAAPVFADCPQPSSGLTPIEEETLTVSTPATKLTPEKYQPPGSTASMAVVQVKVAPITYRLKGSPSAPGDGADVGVGGSFTICGIDSIKAIRLLSSGTATLFITYYKGK